MVWPSGNILEMFLSAMLTAITVYVIVMTPKMFEKVPVPKQNLGSRMYDFLLLPLSLPPLSSLPLEVGPLESS